MTLTTALAALMLAAAPPPPPPAAAPVVVQTPQDEKLICRKDKAAGSRLATKRVCLTARQWEAQRMEDRQRLEQGQAQRAYTGGT